MPRTRRRAQFCRACRGWPCAAAFPGGLHLAVRAPRTSGRWTGVIPRRARRCSPAILIWRSAFPGIWYLARIDMPGQVLAGATAPGVPFLVLGRNGKIAWTFTTTGADVQDIFVETPAGPGEYQTPEGPKPFTVREERIKVRGRDDELLTVRETRHGPVISDLDHADGPILAVAMGNLQPNDTAAAGLLGLNRAGSVEEARVAAARSVRRCRICSSLTRRRSVSMSPDACRSARPGTARRRCRATDRMTGPDGPAASNCRPGRRLRRTPRQRQRTGLAAGLSRVHGAGHVRRLASEPDPRHAWTLRPADVCRFCRHATRCR